MAKSSLPFPRRGSVYLVNLDPTFGSEIKKTRPAVVIQNDIGNKNSPLTIVAPITSAKKYPHPVYVNVRNRKEDLIKIRLFFWIKSGQSTSAGLQNTWAT